MNCRYLAVLLVLSLGLTSGRAATPVEQWGMFEVALDGPTEGNPFVDVEVTATFSHGERAVNVSGFYDGNGVYKIRFSPDATGEWRYESQSNRPELKGRTGTFTVSPPAPGNHGPVRVAGTFHFAYADGTPFRPIGTTCYLWTQFPEEQQTRTLQTLAASPFNKLRLCVLPQARGRDPLRLYPYEGAPPKAWDTTRFNPEYFRHFEQRIGQLRDLGIEADVILFHPYDAVFGFSALDPAADDRYVRYVVARLAAYRNVWWSLANEYDLIKAKHESDWDRIFQLVQNCDPFQRLRSIHHSMLLYNNTHPWVTHASIQNGAAVLDPERAGLYRDVWRKPVVYDEVKYEGQSRRRWGQLTGEEMVLRFWNGIVAGTYVGHGETLMGPTGAWLSGGGELRGTSVARIAFLRDVLRTAPAEGIEPIDKWQERRTGGKAGEYYLVYLGEAAPTAWPFVLYRTGVVDGMKFTVEVIDTWAMTITPVAGVFECKKRDDYSFADKDGRSVPLPGRPYQAIRIRRVGPAPVVSPASEPADL